MSTDLPERLMALQQEIRACAADWQCPPPSLVAVSKTQPSGVLEVAVAAGQRVFAENRVQEAAQKWPAFRAWYPDLRLHLIGPLQTNKARLAVQLFDVVETLDRLSLAETLARLRDGGAVLPRLLVQVNTGEEPQKSGVMPLDAPGFIDVCRNRFGLPVAGLMVIPPADQPPAPHFALLAQLAREAGLATLSMGMSHDWHDAVALGATHIRLGTALFGPRQAA